MSVAGPPAIRLRGVGRFFGPRTDIDGATQPREAWRLLMRIAGFEMKSLADETQRTVAAAGYVLRDISLDIERGSVVCLSGPSGCGKTVLLQMLAGAVPPTAGRIEIYAPVTRMLSAGDQLDGRITAFENIQQSPAYLQASPEGAAAYLAEVIEFAGLHDFEHVALRTFSTGMSMRLGVALALCGSPSIILIDDVLTVGDIGFQQKVIDRLHALKEAGATIVLASSNDELVQQLATRIITLGNGHVVGDAPPRHWAQARATSGVAGVEWQVVQDLPEDAVMALREIAVASPAAAAAERHVDLALAFEALTAGVRCRPSVFLMRGEITLFRSLAPAFIDLPANTRVTWTVRIPAHMLPAATYSITVNMQSLHGDLVYAMKAYEAVTLTVRREGEEVNDGKGAPLLSVAFPWEADALAESVA